MGLEYDLMVIAGLTAGQMPLGFVLNRSEDQAVRRDAELMERSLLYVAMTRAREAVLLTAPGRLTPWAR